MNMNIYMNYMNICVYMHECMHCITCPFIPIYIHAYVYQSYVYASALKKTTCCHLVATNLGHELF